MAKAAFFEKCRHFDRGLTFGGTDGLTAFPNDQLDPAAAKQRLGAGDDVRLKAFGVDFENKPACR
jgi:hypothetical protein